MIPAYDEVRPCHYLRRSTRSSIPSTLLFVDTETSWTPHPTEPAKQVHRFRLGCCSHVRFEAGRLTREERHDFKHYPDFWRWVDRHLDPRRPAWLFAHRIAFDLTTLCFWDFLDSGHYFLEDPDALYAEKKARRGPRAKRWQGLLVTDDPPVIIKVRRGECTLNLIDTRNYWPESLAKIGERHGIPKLPLPAQADDNEQWYKRCRRDVEILQSAVTSLVKWWHGERLGNFRPTAAGLSWSAYTRRYLPEGVLIHGHKNSLDLERAAYYGGACHCFYVGKVRPENPFAAFAPAPRNRNKSPVLPGPVYVLDVHGFYPSLMRANLFPCELAEYRPKGSIKQLEQLRENEGCIARIVVNTRTVLPHKLQKNQTVHCRGKFVTVLCWPELREALAADSVEQVGETATYTLKDLFSGFVCHFQERREAAIWEGNSVADGFFKLILNSLAGKWGQRSGRWEDRYNEPIFFRWGSWFHGTNDEGNPQYWRAVGDYAQALAGKGEGPQSFPAISAFITSYGRVFMSRARAIAGENQVLYQDTDSLHVLGEGYKRLVESGLVALSRPGSFYVKEASDHADYFGLKHYQLADKLVCAGVRLGNEPYRGQKLQITTGQRLSSILAQEPDGSVTFTTRSLKLALDHPDGITGADGWVVPPTLC